MQLATAADAADLLGASVAGAGERVAVAYLDGDRHVLKVETIAGDGSSAPLNTRVIAETVLRLGAAGLILAHNHPSGDLRPSAEDILATRRVAELAQALDIRLHDHLIFADGGCHSMRASGLL